MPREPLPVTAVVSLIRDIFESSELFSDLWVVGEVSNFTRSQVGHRYFSLKDEKSVLRTVLFRDTMPRAKLKNGDRVLAHGRLSVYVPRGDVQLLCDFVKPEGVGIQAARLQEVRERLEREGLFDPARKRALPPFPRRIGVVTSATGAALQDVRRVLASRWPPARLVVAASLVQGEQAVHRLLESLENLSREPELDLVILARGGGSAEDLAAFNDEAVARAVFAFPTPIVTGLGHETDWTLADLAADLRAPTPSAAVERSTPDIVEVRNSINSMLRRAEGSAGRAVTLGRRELQAQSGRMTRAVPPLGALRRDCDDALARMAAVLLKSASAARTRLAETAARAGALDPHLTLRRGFAVVEHAESGAVISSAADVKRGDLLRVGVEEGSFEAEVR
ncbi:MAG: exodeoxyribonuclease VII large subunit [Dehalococcoidia bacterium]